MLGIVSILAWRRWSRGKRVLAGGDPMLNRRTAALIGRVVPLERAIVNGQGRVQIADAYWDVVGPDLPGRHAGPRAVGRRHDVAGRRCRLSLHRDAIIAGSRPTPRQPA